MDDTPAQPGTGSAPGAPKPPTGPIGEARSIGFSILWFVVSLGLYGVYWTRRTETEIRRHTGRGLPSVAGLVILYVIGLTFLVVPSEVGSMYRGDRREPPVGWATGLWVLVPILGLTVWFVVVPGLTGLWWLLPLIVGSIVWFAKVQGALNRYWESKGAAA